MKFDDLQRVNYSLNQQITYQSDDRVHRVSERWENAREFGYQGDCEDFALAKLEELLRRGWPIQQLRLCFCWVDREADDSGHAVLIVEHERRLWCLDTDIIKFVKSRTVKTMCGTLFKP